MSETRTYFRIRFPAKAGLWDEFYRSNGGAEQWGSLAKCKAILTGGIPGGYKGTIRTPFVGYEVVKITERIESFSEVVLRDEAPTSAQGSAGAQKRESVP